MLREPGRNTMSTPYKQQKILEMLEVYLHKKNWTEDVLTPKTGLKEGWFINTPDDGRYVINAEPVTIEFNTTPKTVYQIIPTARPIYESAKAVGLVPYVNSAAERSGMGHFHIGGRSLDESPFYIHENLLRNVLVFFHKHPSLLFGFAEAYDVGMNSNIETFHAKDRQFSFKSIIDDYDNWFEKYSHVDSHENGLLKLLDLLRYDINIVNWTKGIGFKGYFAHYRYIGLKQLFDLSSDTKNDLKDPLTVEFRVIRPPPTPEHAQALAKFLILVMDYLARPQYLEPFEWVTPQQYSRFFTGTKIQADWLRVKELLKVNDPLLDQMVNELVESIHAKKIYSDLETGLEIFEAYSEKQIKGTEFELRMDAQVWPLKPTLLIGNKNLSSEKVEINGKEYWIASLRPQKIGIKAEKFKADPFRFLEINPRKKLPLFSRVVSCMQIF